MKNKTIFITLLVLATLSLNCVPTKQKYSGFGGQYHYGLMAHATPEQQIKRNEQRIEELNTQIDQMQKEIKRRKRLKTRKQVGPTAKDLQNKIDRHKKRIKELKQENNKLRRQKEKK